MTIIIIIYLRIVELFNLIWILSSQFTTVNSDKSINVFYTVNRLFICYGCIIDNNLERDQKRVLTYSKKFVVYIYAQLLVLGWIYIWKFCKRFTYYFREKIYKIKLLLKYYVIVVYNRRWHKWSTTIILPWKILIYFN